VSARTNDPSARHRRNDGGKPTDRRAAPDTSTTHSRGESASHVLDLQRAAGNAAVVQALRRGDPLSLQRDDNPATRSAAALKSLAERRRKGVPVDDKEQMRAEAVAINEAETLAGKAHGSHGTEIAAINGALHDHITIIEAARSRGYGQAVSHLSAKGMDKTADYGAFGRSMLGNLLWALSGVIPGMSFAGMVVEDAALLGLKRFFVEAIHAPSLTQSTLLGTAGAMLAQFSAGLPSSTSSASRKIMLENTLNNINSEACNTLRRSVPELIAGAVGAAPPKTTTDFAAYKAELELGARYALYGDIYERHLNDGELPSASKIEHDARDQLLRQYVVANSALDDGDLVPTRATEGNVEIDAAVDLMGGKDKFTLEPYELVTNQIRAAAADMACTISPDLSDVAKRLATGNFYTQVSAYRNYELFGYGGRWPHLFDKKVVRPDPEFDNERYLGGLKSVQFVSVAKDDLDSAEINGKHVFSAKSIYFHVESFGREHNSGVGIIDPPPQLKIRYRVEP
jgi:hypothetical protein